MTTEPAEKTPRSPVTAAALSFLLPGLGQYAAGARRRGLLVAMPALLLVAGVAALLVATAARGGQGALLDLGLRPEVLAGIVVVDAIALLYHLAAITDASLVARRAGRTAGRRVGVLAFAGVAGILVATVALHGAVATVDVEAQDTLAAVFADESPSAEGDWSIPESSFEEDGSPSAGAATASPSPSASPTATATSDATASAPATPAPSPTPTPTPVPAWARDGRLNLLLVGSDAGTGRWMLRTDTMIVLSVDVASGRAAMFGIPRNIVNVPLPPESKGAFVGGRFPGMLNALYVYAWGHPKAFPGGAARGFRAVTGAVQELVGVKLDGYVAVDLLGFVKLVNALGGLRIDVPKTLYDFHYPKVDGSGSTTIVIKAGHRKLNGTLALAYARSRHMDSDYGRMLRQQRVLVALRRQMDPIAVLEKAPRLLRIAKDHLWTTLKRSDLAELAALASRVKAGKVQTVRFMPPEYPEYLSTSDVKQIRKVVRHIFDD
jgi:LCP family protein required for cell wall assembly